LEQHPLPLPPLPFGVRGVALGRGGFFPLYPLQVAFGVGNLEGGGGVRGEKKVANIGISI